MLMLVCIVLCSFSFMSGFLPKYFKSEWSYAQFRVPNGRTIVAFGQDKNSIIGMNASQTNAASSVCAVSHVLSLSVCLSHFLSLFLCLSPIVVSADGTFYKALFDPEKSGGECVQESYAKFIKTEGEQPA